MKNRNIYDLGWVGKEGGNEELLVRVQYPKKDQLWGLAIIGSFILLGVSVHLACRDQFFKGARAAMDAEHEAMLTLDCLTIK